MSKKRKAETAIAGILAGTMAFSAITAVQTGLLTPVFYASAAADTDSEGYCLHDTFENGTDGWEGRGGASAAVGGTAYAGIKALEVTGRGSAWHGAMKTLDETVFVSGEVYSFSAAVSGSGNMMLSLQYKDSDGKTVYDHIADGRSSDEYVLLTNANYKLPEGTDHILYVETEEGTADFCIDEVIAAKAGIPVPATAPSNSICGDFDSDGELTVFDLISARKALLKGTPVNLYTADIDGDGEFAVNDLVLLSKYLLGEEKKFPEPITTTATTSTAPETTTTTSSGMSGSEFMASIRDTITVKVPDSVLKNAEGKLEHITYFSKKANRNKGANVWLPPGYDESKTYPVFYVNHGYGGDESAMVNGMGVREIATNLIKSGDAVPMIIVFTNQYTDPQHEKQTGNGQADVPGYDNFVEDLPDSLMPYIESHYPVKTGRENTAVAGFSMGGRESLYIGIRCCDKVGYIGGGAPAPGIFPTKDQFMTHPGVMSKDDMRIDPPYSPYLLMIAGGTNDGMVNDFPKQYSDLFTQHGTENIYISVPGGGHDSSTVIPLMYNFIKNIFKAT